MSNVELIGDIKNDGKQSIDGAGAFAAREKVKAVMEAAQSGELDMLRGAALQFENSDIRMVKDGNGRTVLHFAAQLGHKAICEASLKEFGIDVNAEDDDGLTSLGLACVGGQLDVVDFLIENGADIGGSKTQEIQPIHHAAAAGNTQILKKLIDKGVDIHAPSSAGAPLLWAAGAGKSECVSYLLGIGADANTKSPDGVTALIMATASGDLGSVQSLIEKGADVNIKAVGGVTALHVASGSVVEDMALKLVKALLDAGGDPNGKDDEGLMPIHAAASEGLEDVVEHLFSLTTPPKNAEDWSIAKLMEAAEKSHAQDQAGPSSTEQHVSIPDAPEPNKDLAMTLKRKGDEAFVKQDFETAYTEYSSALNHWTQDKLVWANRAAALLRINRPEEALVDAKRARMLDANYVKGWFREGCALRDMKKWEDAALAFYEGLRVEPENKDLAKEFQKVIAEGRKEHVKVHAEKGCGCC